MTDAEIREVAKKICAEAEREALIIVASLLVASAVLAFILFRAIGEL